MMHSFPAKRQVIVVDALKGYGFSRTDAEQLF